MLAIAMVIVLVASWPWIRVGKTHSAMECFLSSLLNTKSTASNGEEKHACWDTFLLPIFVSTCLHWRLCLDHSFLTLYIYSHFTKCLNFIFHVVHTRKPGLLLSHGNNNVFYLQNICNFLKFFIDKI